MNDANSERARSALSHLDPHNRETWVRAAFAIKSEFGEDGFAMWDEWGSEHKRPANEVKATWKSAKPGGKVGIGSLYFDAKSLGWKDEARYPKPSKAEIAARKKAADERAAAYQAEEAAAEEAAAARAAAMWAAAEPATDHPYLVRKGVQSHGLRVGTWEYEYVDHDTGEVLTGKIPDCLLVPIMDRQRGLHSLQAIEPAAGGKKRYLKDGAKRGHFFPIGKPQKNHAGKPVFVLAEGYATAASVHEASGHMVLVCFDVSNIRPVARAMRERVPDAVILIAADNDQKTAGNPGVTEALSVAEEVSGLVCAPSLCAMPEASCDFNDLLLEEGPDAVNAYIEAALLPPMVAPGPVAASPDEAPPAPTLPEDDNDHDMIDPSGHFTILGYDRGTFFIYVHEHRQVHAFTAGELAGDATMLMIAPLTWWEMNFNDNKGGINKKMYLNWFFRLAPQRGIYDLSRLRGRGAWVDEGRTLFHHGGHLTVDGQLVDVAKIKSRYVYELSASLPLPAEVPLSDADGEALLALSRSFRWSKPGAAALLAGWTFLAPVCGALRWRPHIWINGGAGSGKSTILNQYVATMLGGVKVFAQGNSTEAGIRQKLTSDALPVLFDESEQNNEAEKKRIEGVLALIRQASTESEAQTLKGTLSGKSSYFHVRSMFCLASIQVGMENKADLDRLTKLTLLKPDEGSSKSGKQWSDLKDALYQLERDTTMPGRLLRRALDLLPVVHKNITVFVTAAAKKFGTQRMGDQYGTLLAGAWCLCSGKVATQAEAEAMIDGYDWSEFTEAGEEDDSDKALRTVLEAKLHHKGEVLSVGTLIALAANRSIDGISIEPKVALRMMRENGMNFHGNMVAFQNGSLALKKLVSETPFAADLRGQLLRVSGAKALNPLRFGTSATLRAVGIPTSMVLGDDLNEPPL